jgi:hypothetical protein
VWADGLRAAAAEWRELQRAQRKWRQEWQAAAAASSSATGCLAEGRELGSECCPVLQALLGRDMYVAHVPLACMQT